MIQAQHISGIHDTIADMESRRTFFKNQWQIKPCVFEELNKIWGPFKIDLFADRTTKLLPRYVSWLPDPDAIHTDAFSIPWTKLMNPYGNPPWNLISRTLHKIRQERLHYIVLVVPYLPSAIWFPQLTQMALSRPLLLPPQAVQATSHKTAHPLLPQNWMLSVWQLSGINW
ncbi:hypothetical protein G6F62_013441 [Rhizopus arrhizus]|nr:hypothetical protein G6F62_013441 [Rhizopus arrhizus]